MLKYLRIAVTVLSLTACVLLIALWVRSYSHLDEWHQGLTKDQTIRVDSTNGLVNFIRFHWRGRGIMENDHVSFVSPPSDSMRIWADPPNLPLGFGMRQFAIGQQITVPHWFLAGLLASIAAIAWPKWSRRFSLRTLLIATTLVAAVLGMIVAAR